VIDGLGRSIHLPKLLERHSFGWRPVNPTGYRKGDEMLTEKLAQSVRKALSPVRGFCTELFFIQPAENN
jgi:hypothetical protein